MAYDEALCRDLLSDDRAVVLDGVEETYLPAVGNDEHYAAWAYGEPDSFSQLKEFIKDYSWSTNYDKKSYVENPKIYGVERQGVWRVAEVKRLFSKSRNAHLFILHLKYGFSDTLNDAEAMITKRICAPSNDEYISSSLGSEISDTRSDDVDDALTIVYPNLNPDLVETLSVDVLNRTFVNPEFGGQQISGTFHVVTASYDKSDDGAGSVTLLIAKPQYTLRGFSDSNTIVHTRIGYMWGVPKTIAQDIIDAWDEVGTTGRGANASYAQDAKLVNIILTSNVSSGDNLSTEWIPISYGVWRRWHFGWGYNKTQVDAFQSNHDSAIGTEEPDVDGRSIMTRNFEVSNRGQYYDVICVETSFGPHADPYDFYITVGPCNLVANTTYYGWSMRRTELAAVKALFEGMVAVGVSVDFKITRDDADAFDYVCSVVETSQIDATASASAEVGDGVSVTVSAHRGVNPDNLSSLVPDPGKRKTITIDLSPRDDGLSDAKIQLVEVQKNILDQYGDDFVIMLVAKNADSLPELPTGFIFVGGNISPNDDGSVDYSLRFAKETGAVEEADSGSNGIKVSVASARYAEIGALQAKINESFLSDKRKSISADISIDEYGKVSYSLKSAEVVATDSKEYGDSVRKIVVGKNADDLPTTPAGMMFASGNITPNDDGTFDYSLVFVSESGIQDSADTGTDGIRVRASSSRWADIGELQALIDSTFKSGKRKSIAVDISPDDNGKINYSIRSTEVQSTEEEKEYGKVTVISGKNRDSVPDAPAGTIFLGGTFSPNDDGTFDYNLQFVDDEGIADSAYQIAGTVGIPIGISAASNASIGSLQSVLTALGASRERQRLQVDLSTNQNGTTNYTVRESSVSYPQGLASVERDVTDKGRKTEIWVGKNVNYEWIDDVIDGYNIKSGIGIDVSIDISPNDDGSYDYKIIRVTSKSSTLSSEISPTSESQGVRSLSIVGTNLSETEVGEQIALAGTSGPNTTLSIDVRPNPDGGYDLSVKGSATAKVNDSADVVTGGISSKVHFGRGSEPGNLESLGLTGGIGKKHSLQYAVNESGAEEFVVVEQQEESTDLDHSFGEDGVKVKVFSGKNIDPTHFASTILPQLQSSKRVSIDARINLQPDGGMDYEARRVEVAKTEKGAIIGDVIVTVGKNQDDIPEFDTTTRSVMDVSSSLNDDGTVNYFVSLKDLTNLIRKKSISETFSYGNRVIELGSNVEESEIPTAVDSDCELERFDASPGSGGRWNYVFIYRIVDEMVASADATGTGILESSEFGKNVDFDSIPDPSSERLKRESVDIINIDEHGKATYRKNSTKIVESEAIVSEGTIGEQITREVFKNADPVDIVNDPVVSKGKKVQYSIELDDAGNATMTKITAEKTPQTITYSFGSMARSVSRESTVGTDSISAGTAAQGVTSIISAKLYDDGTADAEAENIVSHELIHSGIAFYRMRGGVRPSSLTTRTATVFKNSPTLPSPSQPFYYFENLSLNDDDTYDGVLISVEYEGVNDEILTWGFQTAYHYELSREWAKDDDGNWVVLTLKSLYKWDMYMGTSIGAACAAFENSVSHSGPSMIDILGTKLWTSQAAYWVSDTLCRSAASSIDDMPELAIP